MVNCSVLEKAGKVSIVRGDIFSSKSQTLVNTVNCNGVMGAGLAKNFKSRYPQMFQDYKKACISKILVPGKPYLWKNDRGPWVLNFPTKDHWRQPSKIEWIESGLKYLGEHYQQWGIGSIAFPALGCNLGGLSWLEVKEVMLKHLVKFSIAVEIYQPNITTSEKVLEIIKKEMKNKYGESLDGLYLCRNVFPHADEWTDLKNAAGIHICIVSNAHIDFVHLSDLNQLIAKKYRISVKFSLSKGIVKIAQTEINVEKYTQMKMFEN